MSNYSKKVTTKEDFFCNYEVSLLHELYGNRVKGTGIPFQYPGTGQQYEPVCVQYGTAVH